MSAESTFTKRFFLLIDRAYYKAQNPPVETARLLSNLVVKRDIRFSAEFPDTTLDLLYAERPLGEAYPLFFHIHGGGFSAGDKKYRDHFCARIALETGALVVNINHPLGPECVAPDPLRCLVRGANWVKAHAAELSLDLTRAMVGGDSSGAYYAAMLGVIPWHERLRDVYGDQKLIFTSAMLSSGVYDLERSLRHKLPFGVTRGVCKDITGLRLKEAFHSPLLPYMSPMPYVTDRFPKSFIVYAEKDVFAPGQAEDMIERLRVAGVPVEEYHSTRLFDNHGFLINGKNKVAREANDRMISFMKECFSEEETFYEIAL